MEKQQFILIIGFVFAVLIGFLGKKRKIGFGWSFVISLFLSPLIGLIVTLLSKKKEVEFIDVKKDN
jgi:LPXTG-motif cell wall-anchored protein